MRNAWMFGLVALTGCIEQGFQGEEPGDMKGNPLPVGDDHVIDQHVQTNPTQADVLFVISNWWSMEQAYAELIEHFEDMINVFLGSGIDFHIGVISTDTDHVEDRGKLNEARGVRWIEQETPDPMGTFAEMATMDASGCVGPRRPRDATLLALEHEKDAWNVGFRREDASMHTVFVSDDRDLSVMLSLDEWIGWYNSFTKTPEIDTLSVIVDLAKDTQNIQAMQEIGGTSHHILQMPWPNVLEEIGLRAQGMKKEFFLSRQPDVETIEVRVIVNGAEVALVEGTLEDGGDWAYESIRNSVFFHEYEPPEGAVIEIEYDAL